MSSSSSSTAANECGPIISLLLFIFVFCTVVKKSVLFADISLLDLLNFVREAAKDRKKEGRQAVQCIVSMISK